MDDYEHYKEFLCCDDYDKIIGGEHIYNEKDFIKYLEKVRLDRFNCDKYKKELEKYHTYFDGNSAKRLYEFIMKNILK